MHVPDDSVVFDGMIPCSHGEKANRSTSAVDEFLAIEAGERLGKVEKVDELQIGIQRW